jgi:hypothetical protein
MVRSKKIDLCDEARQSYRHNLTTIRSRGHSRARVREPP